MGLGEYYQIKDQRIKDLFKYKNTDVFQTARLYDVSQNVSKTTLNFKAASLACCIRDDDRGYAGGLDKSVHALDLNRGTSAIIGSHDSGVSCLSWCSQYNALFSGSWDSTVSSWDTRSTTSTTTLNAGGKVYSMSLTDTRLVFATSNNQILVYDIRNMGMPEQQRESPLKHQVR